MGQMSQLHVMFYGTVKVKRCLSRACHTMALEASDARSVAVPCSHPTYLTQPTQRFTTFEIFNHLITIFCPAFENHKPESIIGGHITTKGRVNHYFKAIYSVAVLVIEVKFRIGSAEERMNAVAQVVAECNGQVHSWLNVEPMLINYQYSL